MSNHTAPFWPCGSVVPFSPCGSAVLAIRVVPFRCLRHFVHSCGIIVRCPRRAYFKVNYSVFLYFQCLSEELITTECHTAKELQSVSACSRDQNYSPRWTSAPQRKGISIRIPKNPSTSCTSPTTGIAPPRCVGIQSRCTFLNSHSLQRHHTSQAVLLYFETLP